MKNNCFTELENSFDCLHTRGQNGGGTIPQVSPPTPALGLGSVVPSQGRWIQAQSGRGCPTRLKDSYWHWLQKSGLGELQDTDTAWEQRKVVWKASAKPCGMAAELGEETRLRAWPGHRPDFRML